MISSDSKIGIGIITCNRPKHLKKLINSLLPVINIHRIVVINDGNNQIEIGKNLSNFHIINNPKNLGVAKTKNKALKHLIDSSCEHIFLIEDDIYVKNCDVFNQYVLYSKTTGIQHFNFSQHGLCNKKPHTNIPNPRLIVDYGKIKVPFFPACVGAFSYYTKKCLQKTGLMDEEFYNACEHVEHTHRIHLAGMHTPYWWYPDILNSQEFLGDEEWSMEQSLISSRDDRETIWSNADKHFARLYGCTPRQMKDTSTQDIAKFLKQIKP